MDDIYQYQDYRKFLRDRYLEKQAENTKFTHRVIGQKGGFDPGLFSKVLVGQRNISNKLIPLFCLAFELEGKEAQFFSDLVQFNQAKVFGKKKKLFEKLLKHGGGQVLPVARGQYELYSEWYHSAIRELLNFYPFRGDYAELGKQLHPPIGVKQAKQSVALLTKLGLITKAKGGGYTLAAPQITTGHDSKSVAVDNFLLQTLELAKGGLERIPGSKRNFSSLTFSVPREKISDLEDRIRAFRKETNEWIRTHKTQDAVYQLNLQLFPLTLPKRGRKDG